MPCACHAWERKTRNSELSARNVLLHRRNRLVETFPTRPRSPAADNIQLAVAPADQGWGGVWGQQGGVGVGVLLLRWRSSVVPRGTRRPLAGVCWSGPTPGSIRSSPEPPVGACGLRQPSPWRAAAPGAAAATASWCGDRCCCRYGPLRQLCGRDLRALAAPARCPEAALPARHSWHADSPSSDARKREAGRTHPLGQLLTPHLLLCGPCTCPLQRSRTQTRLRRQGPKPATV